MLVARQSTHPCRATENDYRAFPQGYDGIDNPIVPSTCPTLFTIVISPRATWQIANNAIVRAAIVPWDSCTMVPPKDADSLVRGSRARELPQLEIQKVGTLKSGNLENFHFGAPRIPKPRCPSNTTFSVSRSIPLIPVDSPFSFAHTFATQIVANNRPTFRRECLKLAARLLEGTYLRNFVQMRAAFFRAPVSSVCRTDSAFFVLNIKHSIAVGSVHRRTLSCTTFLEDITIRALELHSIERAV